MMIDIRASGKSPTSSPAKKLTQHPTRRDRTKETSTFTRFKRRKRESSMMIGGRTRPTKNGTISRRASMNWIPFLALNRKHPEIAQADQKNRDRTKYEEVFHQTYEKYVFALTNGKQAGVPLTISAPRKRISHERAPGKCLLNAHVVLLLNSTT